MPLSKQDAIESIHSMHVLIERIFNGKHTEQDLPLLIEYFSDLCEVTRQLIISPLEPVAGKTPLASPVPVTCPLNSIRLAVLIFSGRSFAI